jgi:hypothetical protein
MLIIRCVVWINFEMGIAMIAMRAVPRFVYVGHYPNGFNPNHWWWFVIEAYAGLSMLAVLILAGVVLPKAGRLSGRTILLAASALLLNILAVFAPSPR